jgi:CHASE3 domain sensor protein
MSARRLVILGIALPTLLLIFVEYLDWRSVREYHTSLEWVTHTRIVLADLETFLSCVNDAETGQRGYLLTHQDSDLAPYTAAVARYQEALQDLRRLTLDNPTQQKNLDALEPLVDSKFDEMAQTSALERDSNHADAVKLLMTGQGQVAMDRIRQILAQMRTVERGLLVQREKAYLISTQRNSELSLLAIVVGFGFIIAIAVILRRMERMQEIIKICAWTKLIEYQGEWLTMEDYLGRRFNAYISHGMSDVEAKKMMALLEAEKEREVA